jgi:hypothetical protein
VTSDSPLTPARRVIGAANYSLAMPSIDTKTTGDVNFSQILHEGYQLETQSSHNSLPLPRSVRSCGEIDTDLSGFAGTYASCEVQTMVATLKDGNTQSSYIAKLHE